MNKTSKELRIGQEVYHRDVYDHSERLTILGLTETEALLEGDYSGGTHCVQQSQWMPIKGISLIHQHAMKEMFRKEAIEILSTDPTSQKLKELHHMVMSLTQSIEYNPEF